jgi:hypothetical protein
MLIDCGLIHRYAVLREDIKTIENTTFYTVKVIKDLSDYKIRISYNKMILSNRSEKLVFKKVETSKELKWMLDEF